MRTSQSQMFLPALVLTLPASSQSPSHQELEAQAEKRLQEGNLEAALPLARQALAIAERLGLDHPECVRSLQLLVTIHAVQGRAAEALAMSQRVQQIWESHSKDQPDVQEVANNLRLMGNLQNQLGNAHEALALLERVQQIWETHPPKDKPMDMPAELGMAFTFSLMGELCLKLHRDGEALSLFQKAMGLGDKYFVSDGPDRPSFLVHLATAYARLGRYSEALPAVTQAAHIYRKSLGENHQTYIETLALMTELYAKGGTYVNRFEGREELLEFWEEMKWSDNPVAAASCMFLGWTHLELGDFDLARVRFERALEIRRNSETPAPGLIADTLMALASLDLDTGQFVEALHGQEEALRLCEAPGIDQDRLASALNFLGLIHYYMGNYAKALPRYERSLTIFEKVHGPTDQRVATLLNNLAMLHRAMGGLERALSCLERCVAITEKLKPDGPVTAQYLTNLANLRTDLGQFELARRLAERSLAIREKVFGPSDGRVALSLLAQGRAEEGMGLRAAALTTFRRSLAIALACDDRDLERRVEQQLALFHARTAPTQAIFWGKAGLNVLQSTRTSLRTMDRETQTSYLAQHSGLYRTLADLLLSQGRNSEAQQVLSMLKEDELASFNLGEGTTDPRVSKASMMRQELAWAEALNLQQVQLISIAKAVNGLRLEEPKDTDVADRSRRESLLGMREKALRDTETLLAKVEDEAAHATPPSAITLPRTKALQATLRGLGHGAVALHYLVLPERIHILLTTPDRLLARTVRVKEDDLQKTLSDFRAGLQDDWRDPKPEGKALYDLLIAPVEADLAQAGAKTLMLSMDGSLRYIPFAALWDGKQYLVQRWATAMVAEAGQASAQAVETRSKRFQGFGLTEAVEGFNALPAVGRELRAISRVLPGPVKLNQAFTRTSLEEGLSHRPCVLHISSHFLFSPLGSAESFLVLGDGSHFSLRDIDRSPMPFTSLDLLTLSACETGVGGGMDANGLEVESLRARLQMKGAKAVLATLWPVDDDSTGAFMADFYRRWKHIKGETKGETKAEAMRQAQVALIQGRTNGIAAPIRGGASTSEKHDWTHPYYWAPFVLSGDWR